MGTLQFGILLVSVLCLIGAWERIRALRKPAKRTRRLRLLFTAEIRLSDIPRLLRALPGYDFAICRRCGTLHFTDALFCCTCGQEVESSLPSEEEEKDFRSWRDSYEREIGELIPTQAAQKLFTQWLRANAQETTGEDREAP